MLSKIAYFSRCLSYLVMRKFVVVILLILLTANGEGLFGQNAEARAAYIEKYAELAVREMKRSGIPASITMAQALLESNNGRSDLALSANNHFGIKCHLTWEGRRFYYDDDQENDCFRAYKSAEESFEDHSLFLMTRDRYAFLFDLDPTDYKAWSKGLKTAGYATNPRYADLLIKIIEDNKLYRLDHMIPANGLSKNEVYVLTEPENLPDHIPMHEIHTRNRIKFVVAGPEDNIASLTEKYHLFKWEIRKYNEIPRNRDLQTGQIVYLQPKRKQAERGYDIHYTETGDSWYSISQLYGVKLKWLYKRNNAQPGESVEPGQEIYLRGKMK